MSGHRRCAAVWLCLAAGCAPRVLWSSHEPLRGMRAEVLASDGRQWVRAAGRDGPSFERVRTEGLTFAPGGSAPVYSARRGVQWWNVVGGSELGPWDDVGEPVLSPDGRRIAFPARTPVGWQVVVDGDAGEPFETVLPRTLQFSADGAHLAYVAGRGACSFVVVDGVAGGCHERVRGIRVTSGGSVAGVFGDRGEERFFIGAHREPPVDAIGEWAVTDDGAHWAYSLLRGGRWSAVVDGGAWRSECGQIRHLALGNGGARVAWVCTEATGSAVVLDGVAGPIFPVVSPPALAGAAPDCGYVAVDAEGTWVVTSEGRQGPFDEVLDLRIPEQGGPFAFIARMGGNTHLMHGADQSRVAAAVEDSLVLSSDGRHWALVDGDVRQHALWLVMDGVRIERLQAEAVFDPARRLLKAWLRSELARRWPPERG